MSQSYHEIVKHYAEPLGLQFLGVILMPMALIQSVMDFTDRVRGCVSERDLGKSPGGWVWIWDLEMSNTNMRKVKMSLRVE